MSCLTRIAVTIFTIAVLALAGVGYIEGIFLVGDLVRDATGSSTIAKAAMFAAWIVPIGTLIGLAECHKSREPDQSLSSSEKSR